MGIKRRVEVEKNLYFEYEVSPHREILKRMTEVSANNSGYAAHRLSKLQSEELKSAISKSPNTENSKIGLSPVCELPYGPRSFMAASSEAGQMAASDYVPNFFKNRLHLAGRPQVAYRIGHQPRG